MSNTQATIIEDAANHILAGDLVAMPTETVYGLAGDATNDIAVAKIFEAKGRPQFNPLIVHVANAQMAARYAEISPLVEKLMTTFWPGPLSLVLPRRKDSPLSLLASAGLDTIALRAPNHELAQNLIVTSDKPLAAPSANRSGSVSPTSADHVRDGQLLLDPRVILDGGPCTIGVESTIVKIEGDHAFLLRPGGLAREILEEVTGSALLAAPKTATPQAPGMLTSHYAPNVQIRLNAKNATKDEAFLGFGAINDETSKHHRNLSMSGDTREAAANLFAFLHALDTACLAARLSGIAVAPIPMEGLGEAINDRLTRAAAPRDQKF